MKKSREKYLQRRKRTRVKLSSVSSRPRLSVFRSAKHIYAQIIDDAKGHTLVQVSSETLEGEGGSKTKTELASLAGKRLARLSKKRKITKVVFDRGAYKYHGRVRALAEAARQGGLVF